MEKKTEKVETINVRTERAFKRVFGMDGKRNNDQEIVWEMLVVSDMLRSSHVENLYPKTARDKAIFILELVNGKNKLS